jgi:protein-disulfide isomerase
MASSACAAGLADIDESKSKIASLGDVCSELQKRLCADIGEDTESCELVKKQTPGMPPEQCEQMTEKYDEVLASLQEMEQRNKPLDDAMAAKIAEGDPPAFGPDDAAVTVVEFSDFQCPYCSRAANAVHEIEKKYGDKARVIFRQFPLVRIHPQAHLAAQASLAAHAQGKFPEFHDLLFENQKALSREDLEKYAEEIGLDMGKFKKALDDETYKKQVDEEMALGKQAFVGGTPTMFVNGKRVPNPTDMGSISEVIDAELQG